MAKEVLEFYRNNEAFSPPFAFIDLEGNWHEQYGITRTDRLAWIKIFFPTFFDPLPETTWLAVVNYWINKRSMDDLYKKADKMIKVSKKRMDNLYMRSNERIQDIQNSMINNGKLTKKSFKIVNGILKEEK